MRFSENLNLPILQDGDKYSKEIQNEAFNTIDRECTSIKNTIKSALDISEDVSNAIKTLGDISEELSDLKEKQNEDYYELLESNNYIGDKIRDINSQLDNIAINVLSCVGDTFAEKFKKALSLSKTKKADVFIPSGNYTIENLNYDIDFDLRIYGTINTTLTINNTDMFVLKDGCNIFKLENLKINNANIIIDGSNLTNVINNITVDNIRCDNCYTLLEWVDTIKTSGVDTLKINNCFWENGLFHVTRFSANKFNTVEIIGNKIINSYGSGFIIGNDTITEFIDRKNVFCRDNVFKNLSRVGQGSSKPLQCLSLFVDNVVVDGNKFEDLDNDDKNECEAVYMKSTQTSVTNNIFINAGRKDGFLCIKGRGIINPSGSHNSYNHIVSGNKFISTRDDSLQRAFYTNAENLIVSNNIFNGRYDIITHIIDANKIIIDSNIYDTVVCNSIFTCSSSAEYIDTPTDIQITNNIINGISNGGNSYYVFSIRTNAIGDKYKISKNKVTNVDNSNVASRILNIVAGNLYDLFEYTDNIVFGNTFNYATIGTLKASLLILKNNIGYLTRNTGITTIASGAKSINVNHLMAYSPTGYDSTYNVSIQPLGQIVGSCYVSNVTGSRFTINLENAPTTDLKIMWTFEINEINKKTI